MLSPVPPEGLLDMQPIAVDEIRIVCWVADWRILLMCASFVFRELSLAEAVAEKMGRKKIALWSTRQVTSLGERRLR